MQDNTACSEPPLPSDLGESKTDKNYPSPLVPEYSDMQSFTWMPVNALNMCEGEHWRDLKGVDYNCASLLFFAAWRQLPASSVPDDDPALMKLARYDGNLRGWQSRRERVLKAWVRCSDGRFYHPEVAAAVLKNLAKKRKRSSSKAYTVTSPSASPSPQNGRSEDLNGQGLAPVCSEFDGGPNKPKTNRSDSPSPNHWVDDERAIYSSDALTLNSALGQDEQSSDRIQSTPAQDWPSVSPDFKTVCPSEGQTVVNPTSNLTVSPFATNRQEPSILGASCHQPEVDPHPSNWVNLHHIARSIGEKRKEEDRIGEEKKGDILFPLIGETGNAALPAVAIATGATAPVPPGGLQRKFFNFKDAVDWLTSQGLSERSARSLLGKLARHTSNPIALSLVQEAIAKQVVDPAAWLSAKTEPRLPPNRQELREQRNREIALRAARRWDAEP